jgi:glycosyltransferase involved in cell wall biosynthesis
MRVGIYNEPSGTMGGSEYVVSVMAHAASERHEVEIVHHNPALALEHLMELSGLDLRSVRLRFVECEHRPDPRTPSGLRHLGERYRAERAWHQTLSRPYDVFVASTHGVPPFCHAHTGVLLTLFPADDRRHMWPWADTSAPWLKGAVRRSYFDWVWRRRFGSYRHRLSISKYAQAWTKAWWHVDTGILYPPVDTSFEPAPKAKLLLSVGRFATYSHSKRQLETMTAFRDVKAAALPDWCYYSVGGLSGDARDRQYFEEVSRIADSCGARATANVPRAELRRLFARASIFWHAAGYGTAGGASPFEAEHFGIATVEAMAAGAVPVVFDHGGQSEIVEHGTSGYLWKTLDELRQYTIDLARDAGLRQRMGDAARRRAARFSREAFEGAIRRMLS